MFSLFFLWASRKASRKASRRGSRVLTGGLKEGFLASSCDLWRCFKKGLKACFPEFRLELQGRVQEGFKVGFKEGFQDGFKKGFKEGFKEGFLGARGRLQGGLPSVFL